jgi:D-3-phosphoglycerate dehydrogenase
MMDNATNGKESQENKPITSYPKSKIKVLLLENIHAVAVEAFKSESFQVEALAGALSEEQLKEKITNVHLVGIRSKTKLTDAVLAEAQRLLAVGCFCIGIDQVDLVAAEKRGIPVFNSPFSNSRSVAELIIGEIISLSRRLGDRNMEMHRGTWNKSAKGCKEIRGKTLGIVGYGHIGSQLSVLAESMGMKVIFYDIARLMPIGNAVPCADLPTLLAKADFVTLHVPDTEQTRKMIGKEQLAMMKKGAILLNASRGSVVDIEALVDALKSGQLGGAAIDVYPKEPEENTKDWVTPLQGCPNTILTPHIGGSTEEAQEAIGREVSNALISLVNTGSTIGSVNFPEISLPYGGPNTHRILNIHQNRPGVMRDVNTILSEINVSGEILGTRPHVGYLIADVDQAASDRIKHLISQIPSSIRTRILY